MSKFKQFLEEEIFNQIDESTSSPISIRLPNYLNNELDEIMGAMEEIGIMNKSKNELILEFIKAGIFDLNDFLHQKDKKILNVETIKNTKRTHKSFMVNTNFNNNKDSHFDMLRNKEVAAFYTGWKEQMYNLQEGDTVYLYQSGVGFVARGLVSSDVKISEFENHKNEKYSRDLDNLILNFKAISAKDFKKLTNSGCNFRKTLIELSEKQSQILDDEIEKRKN